MFHGGALISTSAATAPFTVTSELPEPGSAELTSRILFEQKLSQKPAEIHDAARALVQAIKDQLERLSASKPNDEESLARHNEFVAFLEMIASGLSNLTKALDHAIETNNTGEPMFLGKVGEIAEQLKSGITEWFNGNRAHVADLSIRIGIFAAGYLFLNACGVVGDIAGIESGVLNLNLPKQKK